MRIDRQVVDGAAELGDDHGGEMVGIGRIVIVEPPAGAVPLQAVVDVEVLLEVVLQRHVDERPPVGGELHARREPALHDRQIARREVTVEVGHVAVVLHAVARGNERGSRRGPTTTTNRSAGTSRAGGGHRFDHSPDEVAADTRPADGDHAHQFVGVVPEFGAQRVAVDEVGRVETR